MEEKYLTQVETESFKSDPRARRTLCYKISHSWCR